MKRYDIDSLDNRDPAFVARFLQLIERPLWRHFRPVIRGLERIPEGPALYVANHNSALLTPDTYIFGIAVYRELGIDYVPYGLGHEVAISLPVAHQIIVPLGAVRASHDNAHRLFEAGRKVLVYPGGDLDAMRSFWARDEIHFGPRRGYIRLALREKIPIVPVVTAGAHSTFMILYDGQWLARLLRLDRLMRMKVCPISLSIPWGLTIGWTPPHFPLPTRIFIEALDPITFEGVGAEAADDANVVEACHRRVHGVMTGALERLSAERRATSFWRRGRVRGGS